VSVFDWYCYSVIDCSFILSLHCVFHFCCTAVVILITILFTFCSWCPHLIHLMMIHLFHSLFWCCWATLLLVRVLLLLLIKLLLFYILLMMRPLMIFHWWCSDVVVFYCYWYSVICSVVIDSLFDDGWYHCWCIDTLCISRHFLLHSDDPSHYRVLLMTRVTSNCWFYSIPFLLVLFR